MGRPDPWARMSTLEASLLGDRSVQNILTVQTLGPPRHFPSLRWQEAHSRTRSMARAQRQAASSHAKPWKLATKRREGRQKPLAPSATFLQRRQKPLAPSATFLQRRQKPLAPSATFLQRRQKPLAPSATFLQRRQKPLAPSATFLQRRQKPLAPSATFLQRRQEPLAPSATFLQALPEPRPPSATLLWRPSTRCVHAATPRCRLQSGPPLSIHLMSPSQRPRRRPGIP
ncbi:uncharacterized protein CMC5_054390 [Chondromyces crocatus]|uniref:Uncharacterized protein n=1 Tax=Chondromyces crocatus TaxID=52 RepID=A0A0K1EKT1_CHOCO|nr:uncharacterized protein CMC5_054390 [Chondromyces crocatus]